MKRVIVISLFIFLLLVVGCGSNKINIPNQQDTKGEETEQDIKETENAFEVVTHGNNEITITITDEAFKNLQKESLDNHINVYFRRDDEIIVNMWIAANGWSMYPEYDGEEINDEGQWNINQDNFTPILEGDKWSVTLQQINIVDILSGCNIYEVIYNDDDYTKSYMIADGAVTDILEEGEASLDNSVEIVFEDDNTVKFKVYGENAKTAFYNFDNIEIRFYENTEQQNINRYINSFSVGQLFASGDRSVYGCEYTVENDNVITGHDIGESDNINGLSVASSYGVAMKYDHSNIEDIIKDSYLYELYIGNERVSIGNVMDSVVQEEYSITPIPDVFPVNDMDSEYFTPNTDDYHIIMMEIPYVIDTPVWYERMGILVYGSNRFREPEEKTATVVMLESYDEFGVLSVKTKIIYNDYVDALYAGTDSGAIILEPNPQIFEPDDSLITEELLDDFAYDNTYARFCEGITDPEYAYLGRFDNVKYFLESYFVTNTFEFTPYDYPISAMTNCSLATSSSLGNSVYDDLQFKAGEVLNYSEIVHDGINSDNPDYIGNECDVEYMITTYSSKEIQDEISYEEASEEYNTAPDNWTD